MAPKKCDANTAPADTVAGPGTVVDFIQGKLAAAEKALKCREEMENTWRGGDDESWRAVGCRLTRAERLRSAVIHGRIAAKMRREVEMFRAVLAALQGSR